MMELYRWASYEHSKNVVMAIEGEKCAVFYDLPKEVFEAPSFMIPVALTQDLADIVNACGMGRQNKTFLLRELFYKWIDPLRLYWE